MRLLHTADWHVGRTMRGAPRIVEHRDVLREIAEIAAREQVDVVLVAGDVFDTAAPGPDAEQVVYRALLNLEATGAHVVVIAGNHDNPRRLAAVAPLLARGRITLVPTPRAPERGGVVEVKARSGETAQVATLPFVSQAHIVRINELLAAGEAEAVQNYQEKLGRFMGELTRSLHQDTVRLAMAHLFVMGAASTGSERVAHLTLGYAVTDQIFDASYHYVALGHLHRPQAVGRPYVRYCGSPLQLDFGEAGDAKSVVVVDAEVGSPARVRDIPLTAGRALRQVTGTMDELQQIVRTETFSSAPADQLPHLKIVVREKARPGLSDEVRALFPSAVDIMIDAPDRARTLRPQRKGDDRRTPAELFGDYLKETGEKDEGVAPLFEELYEEVTGAS